MCAYMDASGKVIKHLPSFARCICGRNFPECDFEDAKEHRAQNPIPGASNHEWTYVHDKWKDIIRTPVRPPSA